MRPDTLKGPSLVRPSVVRPHFLGHEPSQSPLVPDLLAAAKRLAQAGATAGVLSARYGPRFVVTPAGVPLDMVGAKHFVEVADYDPHQDHVLVIGEHAPAADSALHALVYRAKKEVNAIVEIELGESSAALAKLPQVARGRTTLEGALAALETLRKTDAIAFAGKHLVVAGETPEKVVTRALALAEAKVS